MVIFQPCLMKPEGIWSCRCDMVHDDMVEFRPTVVAARGACPVCQVCQDTPNLKHALSIDPWEGRLKSSMKYPNITYHTYQHDNNVTNCAHSTRHAWSISTDDIRNIWWLIRLSSNLPKKCDKQSISTQRFLFSTHNCYPLQTGLRLSKEEWNKMIGTGGKRLERVINSRMPLANW